MSVPLTYDVPLTFSHIIGFLSVERQGSTWAQPVFTAGLDAAAAAAATASQLTVTLRGSCIPDTLRCLAP
jgi:hypothetical protein